MTKAKDIDQTDDSPLVKEVKNRPYDPSKIKVGARVTRMIAGTVPHILEVHSVENGVIQCGWWTFDLNTGAEIDEDLNWGPPPMMTGSYLLIDEEEE